MRLTLISHFYNEQYLLPWWLKYHREIFDDAILIDHCSTDRSREIIEELCPHWKVVPTKLEWFDPRGTDAEVIEYEKLSPGWKIALNTTEFICGDVRYATRNADVQGVRPNGVALVDQLRDFGIEPSPHLPIHKQRHWGIIAGNHAESRQRLLHRYSWVPYNQGRHTWPNVSEDNHDLTVVHLLMCPMTESFIARKMQIKDRIGAHQPPSDGRGSQHRIDRDELLVRWKQQLSDAVFLPDHRFWRETTRCWC